MRMTGVVLSAVLLTLSVPLVAAAEIEVINPQALFPEGPVMSGGKLLYVEYAGNTVDVWDGKSNTQIWKQDGCGPSAIVPIGSNFGITCYDSGQLVVISADGKTVKAYDADAGGSKLQGPNDGAPDGKGGAYFTLSGPWESGPIVGRVVHLDKDGKLAEVANDLHYANGIGVNESEAGRVISFKIEADGTLSDRRLFVRLYQLNQPPAAYPDGLKLGPNGNFFVGQYSAGEILEISPDGKLQTTHKVPSAAAPNMTFSDDGKTMFVMAVDNTHEAPYEGKVYAVPLK
jgi:gluconolactonase